MYHSDFSKLIDKICKYNKDSKRTLIGAGYSAMA